MVALVAIALTVVAPRSEELFGISTTKCLLIGTRFITILTVCLFVCKLQVSLFPRPKDAPKTVLTLTRRTSNDALSLSLQASSSRSSRYRYTKCVPYQDKRQMTTEKAAAEQHMKDLAEQEKQFKDGKKKK